MELRFREIRPDEVEQELTQKDQFNTDSVPLAATLIRESIQNSTDARIGAPSEPAIIKLSFTAANAANAEYWRGILGQLEPHLRESEIDVAHLELDRPHFLTVEDFGTTGLTGSFEQRGNDNFNDFWRRVGRSHKPAGKGGSWGLGKLVFPVSSDIRSFFGLTIRHDDRQRLLMGQAILAGHRVGATDYAAHGFFAVHDRTGFQRPVLDPETIARFSSAVGFRRIDEPGLSVAIPFPREGLTKDALIPIVIENYFFPIIAGDLVVDVDGETISAATFDGLARRYRSGVLSDGHLVGFIREIEKARTRSPPVTLPDNWAAKGLDQSISEADLVRLREAYDGHRLIAVCAPMTMRTKQNEVVRGHFDLFLRRPTDDVPQSALKPLFIRGSITVPNEESNFRNRRAFAALVATEDNAVSRFLRDAENPAHTSWNGNAGKLNDRWRAAGQRLREIRHALAQFHQLLDQAVDRRDNDALKSMLFVADQVGRRRDPGRDTSTPPRDFPAIPTAPRLFEIAKRSGGFTIRGGDGLAGATLPIQISVLAAYDLPVGNPLKRHSPYDFNFRIEKDIRITPSGVRWQAPTANCLLLTVTSHDFSVEVVGFDENRDLVIAASRVENEAPL